MAERKQVDWESVERDYSAGLLSLREIAAKNGVSPSQITRKKNEGEWPKDLTSKIQAKADSIITGVNTGGVNTSVNSKKASEKEVIEANAQAIVNIKLGHRTSIKKVNSLVESLLDEIETLNESKSVENLPMRVDVTKKLMDTLKTSIDKEREAYGITNLEQTQKPVENMTNDEIERKIAELVFRAV